MSSRKNYTPGPAAGAEVRKDGEKWTLMLVRDLPHPPPKVWQALTDPAQIREWAPFDADRSLACARSIPRRRAHRANRWRLSDPVRLAALECRVCETIRHRSPELAAQGWSAGLNIDYVPRYRPTVACNSFGYRSPCTVMRETALSMLCISSGVSSIPAAPRFSSRRCSLVVPKMGTIQGF